MLPPSLQDSLPAGWLAFAGRASTLWIAAKGFRSHSHPPFLDLSWRKGSFMASLSEWRRRDALHSALLAALIKSVHLAVSASILRDSSAPDNQAGSRARIASFCCKSGSA